jgi:WD40 repeat protein
VAGRVLPFRQLSTRFEVGSLCFSPNGKLLAAAGMCFYPSQPSHTTNRLAFWNTATWQELNLLPEAGAGRTEAEAAATVAFSPDGKALALGYRDGRVRLWDLNQQRLIKELNRNAEEGFGIEVTFSQDGHWLASVGKGGSTVLVFDVSNPEKAQQVYAIRPSAGVTWSAIFAPDCKSLATDSNDGVIRFWNLRTGAETLSLRHGHGPGGFIAFSHDGNRLASIDAHGILKVWEAAPLAAPE